MLDAISIFLACIVAGLVIVGIVCWIIDFIVDGW